MSERPKREPLLGPKQPQAEWFRLTEAASVGMEMAIAVAIGWFGGRWLEANVTHWAPWTSRIGAFVGLGAAALAVVRTARKFSRQLAAEEQAEAARSAAEPGETGQSHDPREP